jgi:hypothetical protein
MPMSHNDLLNAIIDDGLEDVRQTYTNPVYRQRLKQQGAIEGFESCRGKTEEELLQLLQRVKQDTIQAVQPTAPDYWRVRYIELQVEWVLKVLSAARYGQGLSPIPSIPVMGRALRKAADILGVAVV